MTYIRHWCKKNKCIQIELVKEIGISIGQPRTHSQGQKGFGLLFICFLFEIYWDY